MVFIPKKIGFFHFGSDDRRTPCASLERAMDEAGATTCLRESVIVLPEAFNIGVKYEDNGGPYDTNPDVKSHIASIAANFECAFVAGLIIKTSGEAHPPSSAAYFINATSCEVLSVKKGADSMAGIAYTPSKDLQDSPLEFGHTMVSALICMDASERPTLSESNLERHEALRKRATKSGGTCSILCVPADAREISATRISEKWPNFHFIFANGCCLLPAAPGSAGYCPSVIRIKDKQPVEFQDSVNKVIACSLEA